MCILVIHMIKGPFCYNFRLGLTTKTRACKGAGQEWSPRVTFHVIESVGKCERMNPTLSNELLIWKLESQWTLESLENNCRGQNWLNFRVIYIIKNLLEHKCQKWARMIHLGTWNISYGQKKGQESNCQFDFQPLKVGNCPKLLAFRWLATYCWKDLDEGYKFSLDITSIEGLYTKLWTSKVTGILILGILGLPTWESQDKITFGC
jgi:hypothetical protein